MPWRFCPREFANEAARIAYDISVTEREYLDVYVLDEDRLCYGVRQFWPRIKVYHKYKNFLPIIIQIRNEQGDPGYRTDIAYGHEDTLHIAQRLWQGLLTGYENRDKDYTEAIDKWDAEKWEAMNEEIVEDRPSSLVIGISQDEEDDD